MCVCVILFVFFPFDDTKVRRKSDSCIIMNPISTKNGLVFDLHQIFVPAHNALSILFVSSTNCAIVSCSGRFVIKS